MSLRRRITAATTLAVAAVALMVGVIGYASARSHLINDTKSQLTNLAQTFLRHNPAGQHGNGSNPYFPNGNSGGAGRYGGGSYPTGLNHLPSPALGGPTGHFQIVTATGRTSVVGGGTKLPVPAEVKKIARSGHGQYFFDSTLKTGGQRIHVLVLTVADPHAHAAIEVSVELNSVDSVLSSLLLTYALLVGGGILLAGLIGALVARAAIKPIMSFTTRTEQVTSELHRPRRLEERGAVELRRLAASFNQTLDALEASIQAQRHLIADASHELRTPMAALRSNIQIFLEADRLPAEDREELQESIIAELDELTQLVADVLDLARGATPSDHVETIELDTVVREAVTRTRRRAPQLQFDTDLEPTVIENAPDRVSRAVSNVIDNARKWSTAHGSIEITLHDGILRVRDRGPGFKQDDLPHVFDRFYRADDARRMPGSGLGLAIVRQAAEAYGGSVSAANAEDGGAVVEVVFGSRSVQGPEPAHEP